MRDRALAGEFEFGLRKDAAISIWMDSQELYSLAQVVHI